MSDAIVPKGQPVPGEPEKKGWLFKWTNYLKGYQRRWFVLSNGLLSYYRNQAEMSHTCRGTISLLGALIHTADSCTFVISNGGTQTFHIRAHDEVERQSWVTALELAKAKAIRAQESDDDEDQGPTVVGGTDGETEDAGGIARELAARFHDLRTCSELVARHGAALQRSLVDLEIPPTDTTKQVSERATLFRISCNAMMNACSEFMSAAAASSARMSRALQHEREQKMRLQEVVEQLARQHDNLEKTVTARSTPHTDMPLTGAERQKRYLQKLKSSNPEKFEELKKKNLEQTKRKYRKVKDLNEQERVLQRQKWKKQKQDSNNKVTKELKKNIEENEKRRFHYRLVKENSNLKGTIKLLTAKIRNLKKCVFRYKKQVKHLKEMANTLEKPVQEEQTVNVNIIDDNKETPYSKTQKFIKEHVPEIASTAKNVVEKVVFENIVMKESLSRQYAQASNNHERNLLKNVINNDMITKYKLKTEFSSIIGFDTIKFRKLSCFCGTTSGYCSCFDLKEHNLKKRTKLNKNSRETKGKTLMTVKRRRIENPKKKTLQVVNSDDAESGDSLWDDSEDLVYEYRDNENFQDNGIEKSKEDNVAIKEVSEKTVENSKVTILSEIRYRPENCRYFDLNNYSPVKLKTTDKNFLINKENINPISIPSTSNINEENSTLRESNFEEEYIEEEYIEEEYMEEEYMEEEYMEEEYIEEEYMED